MVDNRESNVTNLFRTTLSSTVGPTDLTWPVDSLSGAPASPCFITVISADGTQVEFVDADGTFGASSFVCSAIGKRYLEGSSAASGLTHAAGSTVEVRWTAQYGQQLHDRIDANTFDPQALSDGTAAAPALAFAAATTTGIYRSASNELSIATNGNQIVAFSASGALSPLYAVRAQDGSVSVPIYSFANDPDTGIYLSSADSLTFAANAAAKFQVNASNNKSYQDLVPSADDTHDLGSSSVAWARLFMADGTAAAPAYTFGSDTDTGIYRASPDDMRLAAGGVNIIGVQADRITAYKVLRETDGSAAAPAYSFFNDTDTGIYRRTTNVLAFATEGGFRAEVSNDGFGVSDGDATIPGLYFINDTNTGIYRIAADELGFARGGTLMMDVVSGAVRPGADNTITLGGSGRRWSQLWAGTTTINTSDEATKDDIADSDLGLDFIRALRPIAYRFKDGSRTHYGFGAEQVREALDAVGLDDAAFYIDPKVGAEKAGKPKKAKPEKVERNDDESDDDYAARKQQAKDDADKAHAYAVERWEAELAAPKGLRYSELIGPLVAAVQEQQTQIEQQQTQIDALTARLDAAGI